MAWLIMNDEVDYPVAFYPTHIVGKDNNPLPLYIGACQAIQGGLIGLYVTDEDYLKINHDKAYIIIHDPEVTNEDVIDVNWDEIKDVVEKTTTGREHYHIWKEAEPDFVKENDVVGEA